MRAFPSARPEPGLNFTAGSASSVLTRPSLLVRLVAAWRGPVVVGWLLLVVLAATVNLQYGPVTWFDEGSHLHVPKTLVQFGVYADISADGFRYFGPTTGVGPTVLLPIAGVFKAAGIGLLQARVVMAVYLILAVVVFALAARRLHGDVVALVASLLLISAPGINLLYLGRQVLGEAPALAFLMLGFLFWLESTERLDGGWRPLLAATACFGLTALTKNQFTLVLAPTFLLLFVANLAYYRVLRPAQTILPFLAVGAGAALGQFGPLLPLVGTDELGRTLALAREASGGAIFVFSPSRILSSLKFLLGGEMLGHWLLPGLAYGLMLARPRSVQGARHGLMAIFACVGLGWFAFASIGWPRYAFPGLAVATIFTARLLVDILRALQPSSWRSDLPTARYAAVVTLVAVMIGASLFGQLRTVVAERDTSPQQMAAYLNAELPVTERIAAWEPELGFLTDHAYAYPSSGWLDRAVRAQWLGGAPAPLDYDPRRETGARYLLVGKFGKYAGLYRAFLEREQPTLVTRIGAYDLYRLGDRP